MPTIIVNAERRSFAPPLTVAGLLADLGRDPKKLAVEVNEAVVPRADHPTTELRDGDAVEIVTLVGGGQPDAPPDREAVAGRARSPSQARLFTGTGKYTSYARLDAARAWRPAGARSRPWPSAGSG